MGENLGARILKKIKGAKERSPGVHFVQESGETFMDKEGRSDMKLRNRPDPYAFVQFNPVVS